VNELEEMRDRDFQDAFAGLLKLAYQRSRPLSWNELGREMRAGKDIGNDLRHLSNRERLRPYPVIVRLAVAYCIRKNINIPEQIAPRFKHYMPKKQLPAFPKAKGSLIDALGLELKKSQQSIRDYNGIWLLFTIDKDGDVVVSTYTLSRELGADGAPVFKATRKRSKKSIQHFVGAYFANEHQLYLIGTPNESVELRLAIFHIIVSTSQDVLRGAILRVSEGIIISTRCVLVRSASIKDDKERELAAIGSHKREFVQQRNPEIADYLYGLENPPYIAVSQRE
jgi:hypothetical protein